MIALSAVTVFLDLTAFSNLRSLTLRWGKIIGLDVMSNGSDMGSAGIGRSLHRGGFVLLLGFDQGGFRLSVEEWFDGSVAGFDGLAKVS